MIRGPEVLVVEDDECCSKMIELVLRPHNIPVSEVITWLSVFRAYLDSCFYGNIPKVITLDNDINGGSVKDAGLIGRLRKEFPQIKLIGLSCCPLVGVDVDLRKERIASLPITIKKLVN